MKTTIESNRPFDEKGLMFFCLMVTIAFFLCFHFIAENHDEIKSLENKIQKLEINPAPKR